MAEFFLQKYGIFNMIADSFLVEKWGTLEREWRYIWKNCQDSIQIVRTVFILAFCKLLKNEESFGKSFSFAFSAKCFDRNF